MMAQQDEYEDDYFLEEDKMLEKHFTRLMSHSLTLSLFFKLPLILSFCRWLFVTVMVIFHFLFLFVKFSSFVHHAYDVAYGRWSNVSALPLS